MSYLCKNCNAEIIQVETAEGRLWFHKLEGYVEMWCHLKYAEPLDEERAGFDEELINHNEHAFLSEDPLRFIRKADLEGDIQPDPMHVIKKEMEKDEVAESIAYNRIWFNVNQYEVVTRYTPEEFDRLNNGRWSRDDEGRIVPAPEEGSPRSG